MDQTPGKDFPGAAGAVSAYGPVAGGAAVVQEVQSPIRAPHLQLSEGKVCKSGLHGFELVLKPEAGC